MICCVAVLAVSIWQRESIHLTYINSFSDPSPVQVIAECHFQFSVIYSGPLVALGKDSI